VKYTRKAAEKVANAIEVYVYHPEQMEKVAPTVKLRLDKFFSQHPELSRLKNLTTGPSLKVRSQALPAGGMILAGNYWMPAQAATVFENYLSPGLRYHPSMGGAYSVARHISNTLVQIQLGLSAFHLTFTGVVTAASSLAHGMDLISDGRFTDGIKAIGMAPAMPFIQLVRGNALQQAALSPGRAGLPAEIAGVPTEELVNAIAQAGGRVKMDRMYAGTPMDGMLKAFKDRNWIGGAMRLPFAMVGAAGHVILQSVVPRLKLGVFADLASREIENLPPDYSLDQYRAAVARAWDAVDDRLGELVYDNLLWNRVVKDLALITFRAPGWSLGTYRAGGGAILDAATFRQRLRSGDPLLTSRMSFAIAYPITIAIIGAILTYLYTKQAPKSIKDYFFPRTGRIAPNGQPERVAIPSYAKDAMNIVRHPVRTIENKVNPLVAMTTDMLQNHDWQGLPIFNRDDPLGQQIEGAFRYIASELTPIGVPKERPGEGPTTPLEKLQRFLGIQPVTDYAPRTQGQEDASQALRLLRKAEEEGYSPPQRSSGGGIHIEGLPNLRDIGKVKIGP
jgi:hypothetical protein